MTALFALQKLGVRHRFATQVLATGPMTAGRLDGDLVLVGSGDPTLSTDHFGDMVARLSAQGLRSVAGRFLVYGGALPAITGFAIRTRNIWSNSIVAACSSRMKNC